MNILHLSCSPRGQLAESFKLSQKIVGHLLEREPTATLVNRVIGGDVLPHIDANYALSQHSATADVYATGSVTLSDELIEELEDADVVVIGTPMHNLTVPSTLKAWIDHIVRARRTFNTGPEGKVGTLRDRPVYVAVASGGRFSGERARQPDFLTPYLTFILGMIGLRNVTFFSVQGTGLGADVVAEARGRADRALEEHFADVALS